MRIIVALLAATMLAACGFVQLTYNSAPELIYRWLDGYAEFDETQTTRVRAEIERLHRWHRANELPHYAQLLERLARQAPADLTAEQACTIVREVRSRLDALLVEAQPAVVSVAVDFRADQYRQLERKFAKVNASYQKERIDSNPARRFDQRYKRAVERAERFYGTLEDRQLDVIREQLARSSFDPERTLEETRRRQRDTVQTLRAVSHSAWTPAEIRATVGDWIERMQRSPDPGYRAYQQQMEQQTCDHIAALHNSTTPAQRAHAARRLAGYAQDLRELGA